MVLTCREKQWAQVTWLAPLGRGFTDVNPKIESIRISHTTKSSIALEATLNFTNPTPYTANVPFVDLKLIYNGSNVANITGRDLLISPGFNPLVRMEGFWNPSAASGEDGVISGRKLISRYISGRL